MDAEKRKARVGDGIDEMSDEVLGGGAEPDILAPERHDPRRRLHPREPDDPVGVEPAAGDHQVGAQVAGGACHPPDAAAPLDPRHPSLHDDTPPEPPDFALEGIGDSAVVDDSLLRHLDGGDPRGMRLEFADRLRGVESAQPDQAVLSPPLPQRVEPAHLGRIGGNDDLPADLMADAMLLAELDHLPQSADAQSGLLGARLVGEPAVEDAAVVGRLLRGDLGILLEERHFVAAPRLEESPSRGQADEPAADNDDPTEAGRSGGSTFAAHTGHRVGEGISHRATGA